MVNREFGERLELVLKALTLSNGRVAADLAIDKSLVGRWVAGKVVPSAHNLTRLTSYLAQRVPGFSMLDWDRPLALLRERLVGEPASASLQAIQCPASSIEETRLAAVRYVGRWQMLRLDTVDDRVVREFIQLDEVDGQLSATLLIGDFSMSGVVRIHRNRFIMWVVDERFGGVGTVMMSGVTLPYHRLMSGLAIATSYSDAFMPFVEAIVMERLDDTRSAADWLTYCQSQSRSVDEATLAPEVLAVLRTTAPRDGHIMKAETLTTSRSDWRNG